MATMHRGRRLSFLDLSWDLKSKNDNSRYHIRAYVYVMTMSRLRWLCKRHIRTRLKYVYVVNISRLRRFLIHIYTHIAWTSDARIECVSVGTQVHFDQPNYLCQGVPRSNVLLFQRYEVWHDCWAAARLADQAWARIKSFRRWWQRKTSQPDQIAEAFNKRLRRNAYSYRRRDDQIYAIETSTLR